MAFDIIILLVVIAVIFQKLWSVLGTKPTETHPISQESAAKIFDILSNLCAFVNSGQKNSDFF